MGKPPKRKSPKGPLLPTSDPTEARCNLGPPAPLRKQLRSLDGVGLWQIEDPWKQGQRAPSIRYLVVRGRSEATFNRPSEAWRYFQQLTGAPDKDTRPPPPPLEDILKQPRTHRPSRRRRKPSA